jgi:hypothetical protein
MSFFTNFTEMQCSWWNKQILLQNWLILYSSDSTYANFLVLSAAAQKQ